MFVLWAILAGIYAFSFVQLLLQQDTGALIVGALAAAFAYLSRRSYCKRKNRRK